MRYILKFRSIRLFIKLILICLYKPNVHYFYKRIQVFLLVSLPKRFPPLSFYRLGFSLMPFNRASRDTPFTKLTL